MNLTGLCAGATMIILTGLGHVLVIKGEYHFGVKLWPVFLVLGLGCLAGSMITNNTYISVILGIASATFLWCILELFHQKERVRKGYFPKKTK